MKTADRKYITDYKGDGDVIVLLHGFLTSSKYWLKLQPLLTAAGYRVITVDLLGFGHAPKPRKSRYTYTEHVAYIDSIIESLGLVDPFTLVGHSMGALLAARYSLIHAKKLGSLVLLHPPLYRDELEAHTVLRSTGRHYRFLLDSRFRRIGWSFIKLLSLRHVGRHSHISRERSLRNVIEVAEVFDDLEQISTKTMLLVGRRDRTEYTDNISVLPVSRFVSIISEDVSHHSPIQRPQLVTRLLLDFIQ